MMRLLVVLAILLSACTRKAASDEATKASASAPASASALPRVSGNPTDMGADLEDLTGALDTAVRVCQRNGAPPETMEKLKDAQRATYADRDELKMRVDRKDMGDRDMVAWHRKIAQRMSEVGALVRPCAR